MTSSAPVHVIEEKIATFRRSPRSLQFWREFIPKLGLNILVFWLWDILTITTENIALYGGGAFKRKDIFMKLDATRTKELNQGWWQQLLGYGNIEIDSSSGDRTEVDFSNAQSPRLLHLILNDLKSDKTLTSQMEGRVRSFRRRSGITLVLLVFASLWWLWDIIVIGGLVILLGAPMFFLWLLLAPFLAALAAILVTP